MAHKKMLRKGSMVTIHHKFPHCFLLGVRQTWEVTGFGLFLGEETYRMERQNDDGTLSVVNYLVVDVENALICGHFEQTKKKGIA